MTGMTEKKGFFLKIFFFLGPICYKKPKNPKMSIYANLAIYCIISLCAGLELTINPLVRVVAFEILEL
jgi:hypothetical protein